MNPSLSGYSSAVFATVGDDEAEQLADDLFAIEELVNATPSLRAALTATAIPGRSRRGIIDDLLGQKVSAPARRLVGYAALVAHAQDVPAAISWLAHRAREHAEHLVLDEPSLGHAAARQRVGGYATAIFEGLPTDRLEEIEDELFRFARTVEATPALRVALTDRELPVAARHGLCHTLLEGKVQPATLGLVDFTVTGGRTRDFVGTVDWLVLRTAEARGWRVARVHTARPVDADRQQRLTEEMTNLAGTPVELQITEEPELLGGVLIEIGALRIAATARGRLDRLHDSLLPEGWDGAFSSRQRGNTEGAH